MDRLWYYSDGSTRQGPVSEPELASMIASGTVGARTLVWAEGMPDWVEAGTLNDLPDARAMAPAPQPALRPIPRNGQPDYHAFTQKRIAAGVLGILLGAFGIHKFLLGFTKEGIIMLLVMIFTCGSVSGLIGFIEGIIYLVRSDEEFYRTYVEEGRRWF